MQHIRRVVVTGLGLVTPLGVGTSHNWVQLTNGKTGMLPLTEKEYEQMPCKVVARVPEGNKKGELDFSAHILQNELRTMSRATSFAIVAAQEALEDAAWAPNEDSEKENTGVCIGMGMVDLDYIIKSANDMKTRYSKLSPYFVPRLLTNMASGQISIKFGFQGPNHSASTACATGTHAIGDAFRMIKYGDADVMVCGGTEASITPIGVAGFCRLRALSTKFNESPCEASRPFDTKRDGFIMGEGAGVLILEEYEHALRRKVSIYGEILGYGLTGDAYHITSPREDGLAASRAMCKALKEADVSTSDVGYINAHATSTPIGDAIEISAIKKALGNCYKNVSVSSTKGAIGHLLGAAGAVEAIYTILACHSCHLPPTINLEQQPEEFDLDLVPNVTKEWLHNSKRRVALNNSFGFGGTNATLCIASCS